MEEPELEEIPEGYTPVKTKRKKPWNWSYIIGLIIILTIWGGIRKRQNRQVYDWVMNAKPSIESKIEKLSPEELNRIEKLRDEVILIFEKYLTPEEYKDFWMLINKAYIDQFELERFNSYYFKVKSRCAQNEKRILDEFAEIFLKLGGWEKN